jgi:dihydropteroate synthase
MQGTPQTMQDNPVYADVVAEVIAYLGRRRDALLAAGIVQDRIAVDPGIGFGKTTQHNLQLAAHAWQLHALGCPVLVGHSRKRFLADAGSGFGHAPGDERMPSPIERGVDAAAKHEHNPQPPVPNPQLPVPNPQSLIPILSPPDRTAGTIGVALSLARQGVQILRVHDVAAIRQALLLFQATGGLE